MGTIRYGIKFGSRPHSANKTNSTGFPIGNARDKLSNGYHSQQTINDNVAKAINEKRSKLAENAMPTTTIEPCRGIVQAAMPTALVGADEPPKTMSQGKFTSFRRFTNNRFIEYAFQIAKTYYPQRTDQGRCV